ncbi:hypothetical protein M3Y99_01632300 [Aphelenchoides fujianensis]|nr:hypothetical protein M3Y99_01632300 [Aphelenchoides fujianensis]
MLPAVERPGLFARIRGEAAIPLVLLDWICGEDLDGVFFEKARKWRFDGDRFLEQQLGNGTYSCRGAD